ncbi:hypothetical protein [Pseudomonas sp. LS-2]|uniref:hypothetical protein n=1 Tax=Pseudomonas sp. LS-2 TaxID=2315859 RepID=UPI000E76F424|nr:hypothetical protein [Pseudomonas sp. LS-2]RJX78934.1 hypothetical protein D3M70_16065 [Pseudomonas sp. LS-2]
MNLSHQDTTQATSSRFTREFDCWRGLADSEKYPFTVEVLPSGRIRLGLDILEFGVSPAVALALSHCLNDALAIQIMDDNQFILEEQQRLLTVSYPCQKNRAMQYKAESEIEITDASPELFGNSNHGATQVVVSTIPGGGYEFDFGFTCFSFSAQDAIWLCDTLREACGLAENQSFEAHA